MIHAGLVRLALARALRPSALLVLAALLAWALAASGLSPVARLSAGEEFARLAEHGARRSAAWTVAELALLGWIGALALATLPGWRRREVDWLAPRAARGLALVVSTWLGLVAAALLGGLATLAAVELGTAGAQPSWSEGPRALDSGEGWLAGASPLEVPLATGALPRGARLRLCFAFASGASQVRVLARLADPASGAELARGEQPIASRGTLELALPECPAGARLTLLVADPEARAYHLAEEARVWLPAAHEGLASLVMLARLALDAAAVAALALALTGWLSAATGSLALLALAPAGLAGLGAALRTLEEGRVPALPSAAECAARAALCALGLALAAASLARWRRER